MNRFLKIFVVIIGICLVLILAGYIYVINNAQHLLREFVRSESNGKVEITTQKVRYSFRRQQFELINPQISSAPGSDQSTAYVIRLKKMILNTGSLHSLIFKRNFTIDSLDCTEPVVEVIKLKPPDSSRISLPEEISKIYRSIEEVITKMQIRHFNIRSGSFALIRKYDPSSLPVRIFKIDLTITNLGGFSNEDGRERVLFSDRLILQSSHQDILFPDGFHGLRFSKFRLNSQTRQIEIDSCYIYGNKTANSAADFGVFVDTLRLINTDLNALARADIIRVDSTICLNPRIRFHIEVKNNPANANFLNRKRAKDSLEAAFKKLFANLDLHHINVQNAGIDIRVKRGEGTTTYTSKNSNFNLHELLILEDPQRPIQLERFELAIRNYRGFSRDSAYMIQFDSILLLKNKLSLSNFSIGPSKINNQSNWREVKTRAFELEDITWSELIYNNKILAERAILVKPELEIHSNDQVRRKRQRGTLYRALDGFKDNLEISELLLSDAKVTVQSGDGTLLEMDRFNTAIQANALLNADDASALINSINRFSFGSGYLKNKGRQFTLSDGIYNGTDQTLILGTASYSGKADASRISAEKIRLKNVERTGNFQVRSDSISWEKATIVLDYGEKTTASPMQNTSFVAQWNHTLGRNTSVNLKGKELQLNTFLTVIQTGAVTLTEDGKPGISNISITGNQVQFSNRNIQLNAGTYFLNDNEMSTLEGVSLLIRGPQKTIRAEFPKIHLAPDLASILDKKNKIGSMTVFKPRIQISESATGTYNQESGSIPIPVFDIDRLELVEPELTTSSNTALPEIKVSSLELKRLQSDGSRVTATAINGRSELINLSGEQMNFKTVGAKQQLFRLEGFEFFRGISPEKNRWSGLLKELIVPGLEMNIKNDDQPQKNIYASDIIIRNIRIGSGITPSPEKLLYQNADLELHMGNLEYHNGEDKIQTRGLHLNSAGNYVTVDSFSWQPSMSADSFMQAQTLRKNYVSMTTGKMKLDRFRLEKRSGDSILHTGLMNIHNPTLYIYKDMHLPFEAGNIKPLGTGMIKLITMPVLADSIQIHDALITYEEINDKTDRIGIVRFANTQGWLYNFHNLTPAPDDSLELIAHSRFLDSIQIRLHYRESYADPKNGFLMGLRIGSFGLPALNTILEPLASARIDNGLLDTLHMDVIGDHTVARGKMKMIYSNLHVSYLNKKNNSRKTPLTRLINFAANNILLRRKNIKTGTVYFERIRDKSIFNYWMKIVISGAINNAGIQGVNKADRKNHKAVRKMDIPEIDE